MNDKQDFYARNKLMLREQQKNEKLKKLSKDWFVESTYTEYTYHFEWLGMPVIQLPQDLIAIQQLIWTAKPDVVVEMGIARGGSLIYYASILELLSLCDPSSSGVVLGIDVDIRPHNRHDIENHPLSKRVHTYEGSSTDQSTIEYVRRFVADYENPLIILDSNHTHDHVLEELRAYAPLVSIGSYCVVFDTVIDDLPNHLFVDREWDNSANPKTAVHQYLAELADAKGNVPKFEIDKEIEARLLLTVGPDGYLKRIS
jgi:cephalosporin hydroxylase